ncbi:RidA family protein [Blastococcus sp. CCUG 61487]|uniref:RidA family protein n=1 Tax=Blastococcus sp. CCUG 61487 TaxID=1840703 RepID=UPI0010BFEAC7|nr:RidA family protein [Blastococcus sp. CCUG 61487]TKJ30274.1 enamine deaminase RidA [Blastococcus sp. CCUG 61487]
MTTSTVPLERINPSGWRAALGFDQAQLRPAPATLLTASGQGPVDEHGALLHEGDPAAQLALAVENVEALLAAAGMDLRDVLRLTVHAVDVDAVLASWDVLVERLARVGATPPMTLVGVTRLALPGMLVELEITAGR